MLTPLPILSTPDLHTHAASRSGETVLDICAGSGTTGVAAIKNGRRFIGYELMENTGMQTNLEDIIG